MIVIKNLWFKREENLTKLNIIMDFITLSVQ
jgi:hypothetical protein